MLQVQGNSKEKENPGEKVMSYSHAPERVRRRGRMAFQGRGDSSGAGGEKLDASWTSWWHAQSDRAKTEIVAGRPEREVLVVECSVR